MKTKNKKVLLFKIIGFLALGIIVGYIIGTAIKTGDKSNAITEVLKDNCNCKEVNQLIYAKGIQFGSDGLTTEKAEYLLVDCEYDLSANSIEKLNQKLQKEIENFDEFDFLELEFSSEKEQRTIIIRNGKIITKKI